MIAGGFGPGCQVATAGSLTIGSSLKGAIVSRLMWRPRYTAFSSFCSSSSAPTRRVIDSSLGKMPTTSVRRLISPLRRSSGFDRVDFRSVILRESHEASTSASASSISAASFGTLGRNRSASELFSKSALRVRRGHSELSKWKRPCHYRKSNSDVLMVQTCRSRKIPSTRRRDRRRDCPDFHLRASTLYASCCDESRSNLPA